MTDVVINISRGRTKAQRATEKILEQFISREEYPELFGEKPKLDLEIEHEGEEGLMLLEEFDEKLQAYKERTEKKEEVPVVKVGKGVSAFEIIED